MKNHYSALQWHIFRYLFVSFCILSTILPFATAQTNTSVLILKNEKVLGKNYLTGEGIPIMEYYFPKHIYGFQINSASRRMLVQMRQFYPDSKTFDSMGDLVMWDLYRQDTVWIRPNNFKNYSDIDFCLDGVLAGGPGNSRFLNGRTGRERWNINSAIYFIAENYRIGLGYITNSNILEGIDLSTGKTLWKRKIFRRYGWDAVQPLNDSVLIIASEGLHAVNYRTGAGWNYNTKNRKKSPSTAVATHDLKITSQTLSGAFAFTSGHSISRSAGSNILKDNSCLYMALGDEVVCLTHRGAKKWSRQIYNDYASSSTMFLSDSLLWVINYGCIKHNTNVINIGTPFVAAYHNETGKQKCFSILGNDRLIRDYITTDHILTILYSNDLIQYDIHTGELIRNKMVPLQLSEDVIRFAQGGIYYRTDAAFINLLNNDSASYYLWTNQRILQLNAELEIIGENSWDNLYLTWHKYSQYRVVGDKEKSFVIDKNGTLIAELPISPENSILIETDLYTTTDKILYKIDLRRVLKQ